MQPRVGVPDWGEIQADSKSGRRSSKIAPQHIALAAGILLICLGFTIYHAFFNPHPGFPYNIFWVVEDILYCYDDDIICGADENSLQIGDQIVQIDQTSYTDWLTDRFSNPFADYGPGDILSLEVIRNGEMTEVEWRIPPIKTQTRIESILIPILIYIPFWLVGSVVLLSMKPHDTIWRLMILFSYLTAIWLAVGLSPTGLSPVPRTTLAALSWILAAVYLHFHIEVPDSLIVGLPRFALLSLYGLAVAFVFLELLNLVPRDSYVIGTTVAFGGSLILVAYRAVTTPAGPRRVTSRLIAAGVLLAIGPAVIFFIIPVLVDVDFPRLLAIVIPLIAIAVLPFFYLYAIYKRNLGSWEFRINRFIYYYTLFLVVFTIISIVFLSGTRWQSATNDVASLALISIAALFLTIIPLHRRFQRFLDRLAYGSEESAEEIYKKLSVHIPATVERNRLQAVFDNEIMPKLAVDQSAIYLIENSEIDPIYEHNINELERPKDLTELFYLMINSGRYLTPEEVVDDDNLRLKWVRLAIPVKSRIGTEGVWLFGQRYPDDFYSQDDIELFESLADQLAVTIDNLHLIEQVHQELQERKRAEEQQQQYSERIGLIHQIDQAILAAESPKENAQAVVVSIPHLIPCQRASVTIFHELTGEAELIAVLDEEDSELKQGMRLPLTEFDIIRNIEAGEPLILDEPSEEWRESGNTSYLRNRGLRSGLIVPLRESDRIIGSLNIATNAKNAYSDDHKNIAVEVANSLAVAIHNAQLMSTLKENRHELQRLSSQLLRAQEDERKRISHELHDEIGQLLTAITFNLASVDKALPANNPMIRDRLADTNDLIEQVLEQVRTLSLDLRPSMLQDLGLLPTLRWYLNTSSKRLDVDIQLENDNLDRRFDEEIEIALYRIVQEALSNAIRHGQADSIIVDINCHNGIISLVFEDNGSGFDPNIDLAFSGEKGGTGLLGIRERVSSLNGEFKIESRMDQGTKIQVMLPLGEFHDQD